MYPVKNYDPDWTLFVLKDLMNFFEANGMEKSAAAVSKASLAVAGEIQEFEDSHDIFCLPRVGRLTH